MSTRQYRPSHFRPAMARLMLAAVLVYFGYHAFQGDHGLVASRNIDGKIAVLENKLDKLTTERSFWEKRIQQMRLETVNGDLLEERMRAALNLAHPNEIMLMIDHKVASIN